MQLRDDTAFRALRARITSIPMLDALTEATLARAWTQQGDAKARNRLVEANLRIPLATAIKYHRRFFADPSELVTEGTLGLLRAADKFDPDRGARFGNYAWHMVRAYQTLFCMRASCPVKNGKLIRHFWKLVRSLRDACSFGVDEIEYASQKLRMSCEEVQSLSVAMESALSPDEASGYDWFGRFTAPSQEDVAISAELHAGTLRCLDRVIPQLNASQLYVLRRKILSESEPKGVEIAKEMGVSRQRVDQIEKRVRALLIAQYELDCGLRELAA